MPWCPKCKNEYREGIKVCVDCGCDLVEEEQFDNLAPITFGDEEELNSLKEYLEFNKLQGVTVRFDEAEHVYELLVRSDDKGKAMSLEKIFLAQKASEREMLQENSCDGEFTASEEDSDDADETVAEENSDSGEKSIQPGVYQNSKERAEENRSSAWALLVVGICGIVFVALALMDFIPLHVGNPYLFYGVMSAVFVLFIVMGILSLRNAKLFDKKAESENTLQDAMVKWYKENLTATSLDAEWKDADAESCENLSEEMLYFKRAQLLKDKFNHQFVNLDQMFLERFIDEEVYDALFSDAEE